MMPTPRPTPRPGPSGAVLIFAAVLWIVCLNIGFHYLFQEQFTPISHPAPPPSFPSSSALRLDDRKPVLVFFAHPLCPCSRASLHELRDIVAETGNRMSLHIIFTIPDGLSDWEKSDLLQLAAAIPGAEIIYDRGGWESKRFGVQGSGETLLYDPAGKLLFHGGITPSRGHEGDNIGRAAITSFVLHGTSTTTQSPAFGCSLL